MFESGHLTLVSGAGEGEVVSKEVGEELTFHFFNAGNTGPVSYTHLTLPTIYSV